MSGARMAKRALVLGWAVLCSIALIWAGATLMRPQEPATPLATCPFLRAGWSPVIFALGMWFLSLLSEWYEKSDLAVLLALFCALVSVGVVACFGVHDAARFFYLLLLFSAPLVYRLHQGLLLSDPGCSSQFTLVALAALSFVLAVPLILWPFSRFRAMEWFEVWRHLAGVPLGLSIVFSATLIAWYRIEGWPEARLQHIRLAALGLGTGIVPVIALTWAPTALGLPVRFPYPAAAVGMLFTPLLYLRAMVTVPAAVDRRLQRAVVSYLGVILAVTLTVIVSNALAVLRGWTPETAFIALLISLFVVWLTWRQAWRAVSRFTTRVWEGKGASYPRVVRRLSESLAATLDPRTLQRILIHSLARAMHFSWSSLYLMGESQMLVVAGSHGLAPTRGLAPSLPRTGAVAAYIRRAGAPVAHRLLREAVRSAELDVSERAVLALDDAKLWVPLIGGGVMHGLLLIGPKQGGDLYTREDVEILTTLAGQAGVAVHNARLAERVAAGREELGRAHRRALEAVELERRRLARELHDVVIQQIIGVSYQVAAAKRICDGATDSGTSDAEEARGMLEQVREGLLEVVSQLRGLCGDLRPAGLEELGLGAALQGYVARIQRDRAGSGPEISLDIDTGEAPLPDRIALILFRVAQEGLNNALRHSRADRVTLAVSNYGGYAEVIISDDGKGFVVPDRLSELATQDHFGLLSMSERVAQVGGTFSVDSILGEGTVVRAQLPLAEEEREASRGYSRGVG